MSRADTYTLPSKIARYSETDTSAPINQIRSIWFISLQGVTDQLIYHAFYSEWSVLIHDYCRSTGLSDQLIDCCFSSEFEQKKKKKNEMVLELQVIWFCNRAMQNPLRRSNQMLTRGLNMQEGSQSQSLEIGTQWSSPHGGLIGSRPKWDAQRATNGRRGGGTGC